jgi:UDP-glucuronate 4-epimerase
LTGPILITGAAGFIGAALAERFLADGRSVVGIDNLNDYYDPALKQARLRRLEASAGFRFVKLDIADHAGVDALFRAHRFEAVINLAAQAGVRYSLENPRAYVTANVDGFLNVLEACRHSGVRHLVFASSSSVYGAVTKMPFSVHQNVDHPVSLYAATKKSNELMAHCYSHLFRLPTTGLRFFTVYGPWGRPDMALMIFAKAMLAGRPIAVFNNGDMMRDFTYIDDIVEAVYRISRRIPEPDPAWDSARPDAATSNAPYRIYNIGNNAPVALTRVIDLLEENLGVAAIRELKPMQPGDVPATYADVDDLAEATGFQPNTSIEDGIGRFAAWYLSYYGK